MSIKSFLFNLAYLHNYQKKTCGLSAEDVKGTILKLSVGSAVTQSYDLPPLSSHLPRDERTEKQKQHERLRASCCRKECSGVFTHPFKFDIKNKYGSWWSGPRTVSHMCPHCLLMWTKGEGTVALSRKGAVSPTAAGHQLGRRDWMHDREQSLESVTGSVRETKTYPF